MTTDSSKNMEGINQEQQGVLQLMTIMGMTVEIEISVNQFAKRRHEATKVKIMFNIMVNL